jgi:hypothetical protein
VVSPSRGFMFELSAANTGPAPPGRRDNKSPGQARAAAQTMARLSAACRAGQRGAAVGGRTCRCADRVACPGRDALASRAPLMTRFPLLLTKHWRAVSCTNTGTVAAAQPRALGPWALMGGEDSTTTTGDYWKTSDRLAFLQCVHDDATPCLAVWPPRRWFTRECWCWWVG